ncbi:MAG: hypothetical protein WCA06_03935, partial [Terrimicrobiaceae bacterium]
MPGIEKKANSSIELLQIGQSSGSRLQFPELQQEGTFIRRAWHRDCFTVAAAASRSAGLTSSANKPTQDVSSPMCKSKSLLAAFTAALLVASAIAIPSHVFAQEEAPAAEATTAAELAEPTMEQRVADLEAYINNVARTPDVKSKVNAPGPGHNAWQMASTALVLFMTLPGLALFYGGLVRMKNVLSLLAMCMG